MLSVNAASGVHSYKDLIAHGYRAANPLTYSSSGVGSSGHLVGESFAQKAGIKVEHVPYKGASQGIMGHENIGTIALRVPARTCAADEDTVCAEKKM